MEFGRNFGHFERFMDLSFDCQKMKQIGSEEVFHPDRKKKVPFFSTPVCLGRRVFKVLKSVSKFLKES